MTNLPSSDFPIYHVTLLRHGESVGNAEGYHQGHADFELTEKGRAQARALASRWLTEGVTFDHAMTSPLLRARQTAEIIASALNIPLELNPLWMETDIGLRSGMKAEEIAQRLPQSDFIHPYQAIGETGESWWELYLRGGRAVQDLIRRPPQRYLAISHGGILNMVLYAMLGIVPQADFHGPRFRFQNTGFATLTYEPHQHKWRVLGINDRGHWHDED